jgi:hypothetical protein
MILLKGIYELWGDGETYPLAVRAVANYVAQNAEQLNASSGDTAYLGDESKSW